MSTADLRVVVSDRPAFEAVSAAVSAAGGFAPAAPEPPAATTARLERPRYRDRQRVLVAMRGSAPVARVVARLATDLRDPAGRPVGCLGFFEALDDPAAAAAVMAAGSDWLRQRGARLALGPMEGDTWHPYRLNLGPHDRPPFPREPWQPPYYPRLWTDAGFAVDDTYASIAVPDLERATAGLAPRAAEAATAGYTVRAADLAAFDATLDLLHALSRDAFRDNPHYADVGRDEFAALYADAPRWLRPDWLTFAHADDGAPAGFCLAFHGADEDGPTVYIKTLATAPAHRRRGVSAALCHAAYRTALAQGLRRGMLCLVHEGNPSERMGAGTGIPWRRYALLRKALA